MNYATSSRSGCDKGCLYVHSLITFSTIYRSYLFVCLVVILVIDRTSALTDVGRVSLPSQLSFLEGHKSVLRNVNYDAVGETKTLARISRQSSTCLRMSSVFQNNHDNFVNDMLYEEQEKLIVKRGELEEELMALSNANSKAIEAPKLRGVGKAGGFGGGSKVNKQRSTKQSRKAEGKAYAKVLKKDGVVRIDNVLSSDIADKIREYVYNLRTKSIAEIESGSVESIQRFADVLLRSNRCDLTLPVGDEIVADALNEVIRNSAVGQTIASILSDNAELYELSCLISDPGSQRQVLHPDTPFLEGRGPVLYTTFIALQDIRFDMGPTIWLPKTHTQEAHDAFKDDDSSSGESRKDSLIKQNKIVTGILPKGSCAIFDSRLLHCGTANKSEDSRALFYFSFKNPNTGYPGNPASIRREIGNAKLTMSVLEKDLESYSKGNGHPILDSVAAQLL